MNRAIISSKAMETFADLSGTTREVSIYNHELIINLDFYSFYKCAPNPFNFSMIVNVPTDGWCLLYSIQLAMLVDHARHVDLLALRIAFLNEFEQRVRNDQSGFRVSFTKKVFTLKSKISFSIIS